MTQFNPEKINKLKRKYARVPVTINIPIELFDKIEALSAKAKANRTQTICYILELGFNDLTRQEQSHNQ